MIRSHSYRTFRDSRGYLSAIVAWTVVAAAGPLEAGEPGVITIESAVLRPLVEAEVPARQLGVLARIMVDEGAAVREGDLLASLDDRVSLLKVRQAELEVRQAAAKAANRLSIDYAEKALEVARAELKRSEESNRKFPNSISDSQLDVERLTIQKLELERLQAQHELELASYDLDLKKNALEAARLDLDLHTIQAPFAGRVTLVRGRVGEWVEPGAAVVRLVAVDRLRAEGFAPADEASSLVGAAVRFTIRGEGEEPRDELVFNGVIGFVSPEVDPVTRQVRVWAEIENRDGRLLPGQRGEMEISQ